MPRPTPTSQMRSRRSSPISILPVDVLAIIFAISADINPPRAGNAMAPIHQRRGHLGWIALSHVCRKWRGVGLEYAKLWADIVTVFPSPATLNEIVPRTKGTPVILDLRAID